MAQQRFTSIEEAVERIRRGEQSLREELIAACLPAVRPTIRQAARQLRLDEADCVSIGMEMLNLAIDRFKPDSHVPFIQYARLIIRNRLIDCYHRQEKQPRTLPFTDCESPDGTPLADRLADPRSSRIGEDLETAEALAALEAQLQRFGASIDSMVRKFPRHRDTCQLCIRVARELSGDAGLMSRTLAHARLTVSDLSARCRVPVKTIDKNRAAIIFLALLLQSDLTLIKRYLSAFDEEA